MLLNLHGILSAAEVEAACQALAEDGQFAPGTGTAGWAARDVKHNEQAGGPAAGPLKAKIADTLMAHPLFRAAAQPKQLIRLLVSRYRPGMAYGTHVDDPVMGGIRTDLSFTLFLSAPEHYEGGELVLEEIGGDTAVKLPAGGLVLYPATTLHRVAEVTRGERLAVVGWVRSLIRAGDQREALFDLENIIAAARQNGADRPTLDRLLKLRANLLRMWAED